ncbi:hypothetical protein BV25DRAFT_1920623 [Artomyces pyxidatus]|uniref:Uncharacterized protein n=1 Tax=Artomyces pyxidatus TaxID=48021 RepID=A0ACB8SLR0_9AGAM|nr:hypothetical protein BV25DRAFT_1920623 [Artomyces pyxidatus]
MTEQRLHLESSHSTLLDGTHNGPRTQQRAAPAATPTPTPAEKIIKLVWSEATLRTRRRAPRQVRHDFVRSYARLVSAAYYLSPFNPTLQLPPLAIKQQPQDDDTASRKHCCLLESIPASTHTSIVSTLSAHSPPPAQSFTPTLSLHSTLTPASGRRRILLGSTVCPGASGRKKKIAKGDAKNSQGRRRVSQTGSSEKSL